MSVTNPAGEKLVLPRGHSIRNTMRQFASAQPDRLEWLAALSLRKDGWTFELIAQVLGHAKGHVVRETNRLASELHDWNGKDSHR